ncbi:hypothetical protein M231_07467 [Tremella mesenterica]|uniref:Uncharacterized protein n=2 Tax=Tremella mesenterica TaxID=5217 RepID=A0A4Q1B919_TREME|nr:hypothetical protein M231_07467 [Tremella mesenterica]
MFPWKRKNTESRSTSIFSSPSSPGPRPILKTVSDTGGPSIRFATTQPTSNYPSPLPSPKNQPSTKPFPSPIPTSRISPSPVSTSRNFPSPISPGTNYDTPRSTPISRLAYTPPQTLERQSSSRSTTSSNSVCSNPSITALKSSRPHSPSTTSFGMRVRKPSPINSQQAILPHQIMGNRTRCDSAPASSPISRPKTLANRPNFGNLPSPRQIPGAPMTEHSDSMSTPPLPTVMHITTPPMAYVSSMHSKAPPPPSPYRPTHERQRSLTRKMPQALPRMEEFAPRPPRHSSLFAPLDMEMGNRNNKRDSVCTIKNVPVLNVIPATPQDNADEFDGAWGGPRESGLSERRLSNLGQTMGLGLLGEAVQLGVMGLERETDLDIERMEEIPLGDQSPSIQLDFEFSPFSPMSDLPSMSSTDEFHPMELDNEIRQEENEPSSFDRHTTRMESILDEDIIMDAMDLERTPIARSRIPLTSAHVGVGTPFREYLLNPVSPGPEPTVPLPPSPPFESFNSLPSLASDHTTSVPSSDSDCSMIRSSSDGSVISVDSIDVEQALGTMLESLSSSSMASFHLPELSLHINSPSKSHSSNGKTQLENYNPGLGLGLDMSQPSSITQPLVVSPRRKGRPEPLDISRAKLSQRQEITTAPATLVKQFSPSTSTQSFGQSSERVQYSGASQADHPAVQLRRNQNSIQAMSTVSPETSFGFGTSTFSSFNGSSFNMGGSSFNMNGSFNINSKSSPTINNDNLADDLTDMIASGSNFGRRPSNDNTSNGMKRMSRDINGENGSNFSCSPSTSFGSLATTQEDDVYSLGRYTPTHRNARDSFGGMSMISDASDEDLRTASIVKVVCSPVVVGRGVLVGEEVLDEVGVAL